MMVEAVTLANYVKFFTDPFYTAIFWTTLRVAVLCTVVCLVLAFRWPTSGAHPEPLQAPADDARSCCRCSSATPCAPPAG